MPDTLSADETDFLPPLPQRDPADYPDREALLDRITEDYLDAVDAGAAPDPSAVVAI